MTWSLLGILLIGLLGVGSGAVAVTKTHRPAANATAGLGLLTLLTSLGLHGWALKAAFEAVAVAPPEAKQRLLAEALTAAQSILPLGLLLTALCWVLSVVAWVRLRRASAENTPDA